VTAETHAPLADTISARSSSTNAVRPTPPAPHGSTLSTPTFTLARLLPIRIWACRSLVQRVQRVLPTRMLTNVFEQSLYLSVFH
jgi:hypothetical protein